MRQQKVKDAQQKKECCSARAFNQANKQHNKKYYVRHLLQSPDAKRKCES